MPLSGAHVIADLHHCALENFAPSVEAMADMKAFVSELLREHSLVELGNYYHFFGPGAVTATVCLAESHLTFHSWPEHQYVSLDIFLCNRAIDAAAVTERIVASLNDEFFHSTQVALTKLTRSPAPMLVQRELAQR